MRQGLTPWIRHKKCRSGRSNASALGRRHYQIPYQCRDGRSGC